MATPIVMFALVEVEYGEPANKVLRILRTYESESRAKEDLTLLRSVYPRTSFDIQAVDHIE